VIADSTATSPSRTPEILDEHAPTVTSDQDAHNEPKAARLARLHPRRRRRFLSEARHALTSTSLSRSLVGQPVLDEQGNLIDGTLRQELRDSVSTLVALTLESLAATA
jgi:hypothetical protein